MATTYQLISSVTVGAGGAANIEFTSIPATYTDLKLVMSARTDQTLNNDGALGTITINSSTSNFSYRLLRGNGSAVVSFNGSLNYITYPSNPSDFTASTFSNFETYFPNYAGSTNKSFSVDSVTENNASTAWATLQAGLWSNTAAITSIKIAPYLGNYVQYSTAYLYGIKSS